MRKMMITGCLWLFLCNVTPAQEQTPKLEIGAQLALIGLDSVEPALAGATDPGFGGRVTWNLNHRYSLESEVNFLPRDRRGQTHRTQSLFGLKMSGRISNAGVFLKLRPGWLHTRTEQAVVCVTAPCPPLVTTRNDLAVDLGGGLEFYSTRHTMVRFDFGDTLIRYNNLPCASAGCPLSATTHNFQFNVGFGWRF